MQARTVVTALGAGRVAIGLGLIVATRRTAGGWLGKDAAAVPGARAAVRGLGARDLAAGAALLVAIARDADDAEVRRWLLAGALGDTVDAVATVSAGRNDPVGRASTLIAVSAAATGAWAASRL